MLRWAAFSSSWRPLASLWMLFMDMLRGPAATYRQGSSPRSTLCSHGRYISTGNAFQVGRFCSVAALCIGFLLVGESSFADQSGSGGPTTQEEQRSQALLIRIEQQIAAGHFVLPPEDNALATWNIFIDSASLAAPATHRALTEFMERMHSRADEALTEGRPEVSGIFKSFGAMADAVLDTPHTPSTADPKPAKVSAVAGSNGVREIVTSPPDTAAHDTPPAGATSGPTTAVAPADPAKGDAGQQETRAAATPTAQMDAAPPPSIAATSETGPPPAAATPTTALALAVPGGPVASPRPNSQSQALAAMYATRGDEMLARKDISAARKFYEFAADAGNAAAAMALARTFDPGYLGKINVIGMKPDLALATAWYRKAALLGASDAKLRLQALGAIDSK